MKQHSTAKRIAAVAALCIGISFVFGDTEGLAARKTKIDTLTGPRVINGVQYGEFTVYTLGQDAASETYRDEIVGAALSDPKTFNPPTSNESSSSDILLYAFEGLTTVDGVTGKVVPAIADRWESSDDGLVWTFHIRDAARFSDGKKITADDVLFSFNDVCINEDIPGIAMRDIVKIEGKYPLLEKIDDSTVRFTLPSKFAPFVRMIGGVEILPKHRLKEAVDSGNFSSTWNVNTDPKDIVSSGPFKISEYRNGERVVLTANEYYYYEDSEGRQFPQIKRMTLLICTDLNTMMVKFKAGQTDGYGLRGEDYASLRKLALERDFSIYDGGVPLGSSFLMFNQNVVGVPKHKQVWFRDRQFREACAYAIDRQTIVRNVMMGIGEILHSVDPPSNPIYHNPNVKKYTYDLSKARSILRAAGYRDYDRDGIIEKPRGVPVKFILTTNTGNNVRENACQIIASDLKKLGMDVSFSPLEFNNLISKLQSSLDWEAMLMGLTGSIDPQWGKNVWSYDGRTHFWNQKPPKPSESDKLRDWQDRVKIWETGVTDWEREIHDLFNQGAQEMDEQKRIALYMKYQEIVAEQLPVIVTVTPKYIAAIRNKFINAKPTPLGRRLYHNADRELMIKP